MLKLTYTEEMKKQDELWRSESEDLDVMKKLYNEIIAEAKKKGFKGATYMYSIDGEMLCQIFNNEEEKELAALGKYNDFDEVGYCKPLIGKLEQMLNNNVEVQQNYVEQQI